MKKQIAIDLAGSVTALAEVFDITPSAISQWGDDVPDSRVWELRVKRPQWFEEKPEIAPRTPEPDAREDSCPV